MRRGGGIEAIKHRGPMRGPTGNYTRSRFAAKVFFCNDLHNESFTPGILTPVRMGATIIGMPQEERVRIGDVERRLAKKYAALPHDHVAVVVQHAYARFRSSRIRDFIPLLVERRADEELEELSVLRPDLAAVAFGDLVVAGSKA
jgi:hypothetical protein